MEPCQMHNKICENVSGARERIAALEARVKNIEEAQKVIFTRIEGIAKDFRSFAAQLDEVAQHGKELSGEYKKGFAASLSQSFRKFQNNFADFVVYAAAATFVWFTVRLVVGDLKIPWGAVKTLIKGAG